MAIDRYELNSTAWFTAPWPTSATAGTPTLNVTGPLNTLVASAQALQDKGHWVAPFIAAAEGAHVATFRATHVDGTHPLVRSFPFLVSQTRIEP